MKHYLGIDTGGTFTDFIYLHGQDISVHKVLSTPVAPEQAIFKGIEEMGLNQLVADGKLVVIHGTTVATNAVLQSKGVATAYVTNKGLADVLLIGRQTRKALYDLDARKENLPLDTALIFQVNARLDANGNVIDTFAANELENLKQAILNSNARSVAINLLFSFLNQEQEKLIEALFVDSQLFISRSSNILPEYREYERGIVTWVNAWIGPLIDKYLLSVKDALAPSLVSIMQSSGLTISAQQAAQRAVNLLLSGPVGGLKAATMICPNSKLMTFDMGGTSTDVALIDEYISLTNEGHVGDLPIAIPMADIHTIGAGGGSIAYIDAGGILQVGPDSAGSDPGPACYALGGTRPTVTDANLLLGRLLPGNFLGGELKLDKQAAINAIEPLAKTLNMSIHQLATGIVELANEHMIQALRVISVERGYDPGDFTLVCFGGAGGLHFCDLAEALQIDQVIVPVNSGIFSALGMLATSPGRQSVHTQTTLLSDTSDKAIENLFTGLYADARTELMAEGVSELEAEYQLDLRYHGQTHTLTCSYTNLAAAESQFHQQHEKRYGHRMNRPVEMVNLRLQVSGKAVQLALPELPRDGATDNDEQRSAKSGDLPLWTRQQLAGESHALGPMLITEPHTTTYVKQGWRVSVDRKGHLNLQKVLT